MASPFTRKTLSFLRALKRNNDREWFREHKDDYEAHVRQPMITLIERLANDLPSFAPEFIAEPKVSLFRIYRDTRFSADKSPLKTHVAARFPARGMAKGARGGGLYIEIEPTRMWMGGGVYMPSMPELHAIRARIAETHPALHRIVTAAAFKKAVGELAGQRLSRVPRGYDADHPVATYLQFKQFYGGSEREAEFALDRRFYPELVKTYKAVAPLVRFLNEATAGVRPDPTPSPVVVRKSSTPPAKSARPEPMW